MKALFTDKDLQVGTKFKGNVNGAEMEIVKIENGNAVIKDLRTGGLLSYGLQALRRCDIEIKDIVKRGQ